MQKKYTYLVLAAVPVLLFITGWIIKAAGGPYYLNYYDPSYEYLVNSLNILQFSSIGHTDHPGTSVQIFGAIILKLMFLTKSMSPELLKHIFSDPEFYLGILNKSMVFVNCIALFVLGLVTFKLSHNIYLSVLLQLSPFISFEIFYGLVIFAPENFLILSCICLITMLVYFIYKDDAEINYFRLAIAFGLVCGFGAVSKMNFIPLFIIPLILLRGIKYKFAFIVTASLAFVLTFLPAMSNLTGFINWSKKFIFNTGIHGNSQITQFKLSEYVGNIFTILSKDLILLIIYLIVLITLISGFLFKKKIAAAGSISIGFLKKNRLALLSVFIGITFQILIVAKNYLSYAQYYIIPSLMLAITGLALSLTLLYTVFNEHFNKIKVSQIYTAAIAVICLFGFYKVYNTYIEAVEFRDESIKVNKLVKEYAAKEFVIPSIGAANEDIALVLATQYGYAGNNTGMYKKLFSEITSSKIFFNFWENNFFTISDSVDIKKTLNEKNKIIVQLTATTPIENFLSYLNKEYGIISVNNKLLFKNGNGETIYEINLK